MSRSGRLPARAPATIRTAVVGAGAAGAPLAARLALDSRRLVTLIEAGRALPGTPPDLLNGGLLLGALPSHPATWTYPVELTPEQSTVIARGKHFGGSTAVNGGYFIRATPADFADWAKHGGPDWSYEHARLILAALETDLDFPSPPGHGTEGPIRIARPDPHARLQRVFRDAAHKLGFADELDKNAGAAPGAGPVPSNIIDGVRINTADAYHVLSSAGKEHLRVMDNTRALKVVIKNSRVTGIETSGGFIEADEVVLCAGAIASAQLLMLSGIGPKDQLAGLGISEVVDLPVGAKFSDHPNLPLDWRAARGVVDWNANYAFPYALNFDAAIMDRSLPSHPEGDIEILLTAKPLQYLLTGERPDQESLQLLVSLQHHVGRGKLSLRSADPLDTPRIEYHYLQLEEDRRRFRAAVRTAAGLLQSPSFSEVFDGFVDLDDRTIDSDAALDAWILSHVSTALHTCATAPMGQVVDGAGRVHGVSGLRVADTSILPSAPHRGPANTAVFIGELIARNMLEETLSLA